MSTEGRETLVPVGGDGAATGAPRSSAVDCRSPARDQAGAHVVATGKEQAGKLPMHPMLKDVLMAMNRSVSLTELGSASHFSAKSPVEKTAGQDWSRPKAGMENEFRETMEEVTKLSTEMEKHIEQNTRRELKGLIKELLIQVEVLNRVIIKKWLDEHTYEPVEKMYIDVDTQTETQPKEYGSQTDITIEKKDNVTQTEEATYTYSGVLAETREIRSLEGVGSLNDVMEAHSSTSEEEDPYRNSSESDVDYIPPNKKTKHSGKLFDFFKSLKTPKPKSSTSLLVVEKNDEEINPEIVDNESPSFAVVDYNEKFKNSPMLDGKFFQVQKCDEKMHVRAICQLCLPVKKVIKGSREITTNFVKHLRRVHGDKYGDYLKYKERKHRQRVFNNDSDATSAGTTKKKSKQDTLKKYITSPNPKEKISDETEMCHSHIQNLKKEIEKQDYVCATADIWSTKQRSFMGVTLHWIDSNLDRKSVALACKRFCGTHDYKNIGEMLENINLKFGIRPTQIIATVTDNGSNFVKAFREFAVGDGEREVHEDLQAETSIGVHDREEDVDEEDITFEQIDVFDNPDDCRIILSTHVRCASHTLNLIATTDCKNAIQSNVLVRKRHTEVFLKCNILWTKARRPKTAEIIKDALGHTLSYPGVTRWNSYYDSVSQILSEKLKLPSLFQRLNMNYFRETELKYLEEYCMVLKPLASTLDLLQGQDCVHYGYILPSLLSLRNKWEKIKLQELSCGGKLLLTTCMQSLERRFSDILNLFSKEAVISAIVHPQFKFRWCNVIKNTDLTVDEMKKIVITAAETLIALDGGEESGDTSSDTTDFNERPQDQSQKVTQSMKENEKIKPAKSKIELELYKFLDDKRETDERVSLALEQIATRIANKENKAPNNISAFCHNLETEMIRMPSDIIEDFKDEITELLLKKDVKLKIYIENKNKDSIINVYLSISTKP
ncbi:unnamed protein product [Brassicogethes aeneus]|uniref:Uncharacterized protein n=1 Tax=Brassicogethes aeneus TaxID=1431903 RepID=A0A9P0FMB0_BRAAE|nr:unnamed protein product [Brassicogethes aeneus]